MTKLPIAICLFTSTKGHFGHSTYGATLDHLNRRLPLGSFGALYAHVKVSPGEETLGDEIAADLKTRGFTVEQTVAGWVRGMSHQNEYLLDQRKASQSIVLHSQPYMLLLEDDSIMVSDTPLEQVLARMVGFLESSPDISSARFIRESDFNGGVPILKQDIDHFYSPNLDYQPAVLRTRDYFIANMVIEESWARASQMQCEMVTRLAFNKLSRSPLNHIAWLPSYAHTIHLGVQEYPQLKVSLGL